ncbi:23S rRNA (uracil(1939)-C(5))-methyltransferase RlmD [Geomonas sp. Red875]|uniref:23S rRNA (Uracil(1939)-C(5))-methyltransferase RlmD n=1 Tax=Geomesophilobacter sediminis TaxID=2798584 RepID=A0A8J7LU65_9BACT|nr:23S rRNA (uracil(1939)-C(5))-methyltransferase RlmD [Geomesophilobacter sediminis]
MGQRPHRKGSQPEPRREDFAPAARATGPRGFDKGARDEQRRPLLHSGQTVELTITGTDEDGFGVANHEGTRVLVAGALPGEQVVARVTYVGRRETFGNLLRCLKSSPDRNPAPACDMGKACDGCPLIQMRYPAQLAWKKELVSRHIGSHRSLDKVKVHDTIASPKELHYRNSAKLVIAGKFSDPVIGIYRRNSHDVLEIADCPLHHPLINKVVKAVKAGIKKGKVPIYNAKSEMGLLRYLVVRVAESGNAVMAVLVTSEQGYNEIHHLAKFIQDAVPEVAVVAQNINNSTGNVIFGQRDRFLTKTHTLRAYIGEKSFSLSPRSFFQVNSGAAGIIYEKVREFAALKGSERVIDVYCGIGGISLFLADRAGEVVGIEVVDSAVTDATENAALNHVHNCSFEAGDAARLLEEIGEEGGAQVIVLNPPRKGCDAKVLESAAALQPEKMIYVSCSPETLARDLDILSRLGYRTVEVQPVDMFPQTVHVEDVALLVREKHRD